MISLFLILLELCSSATTLKMKMLEIYAGWPTSAIEEKQAAEKEEYESSYAECVKTIDKATCDAIYETIQPKLYCNEETLNNVLSTMDSGVIILVVVSYGCTNTINLNQLSRKIPYVSLTQSAEQPYYEGRKLSSTYESAINKEMLKIAKEYKNISQKEAFNRMNRIITNQFSVKKTKVIRPTLRVQGGIKDKVSFLLLSCETLNVVGSPLDCENIYRFWFKYALSSYMVKPTYLVIPDTIWDYFDWGYEEPEQMIIQLVSIFTRYTRISYTSNSWVVICDDSKSFNSYNRVTFNIPYIRINKLGVSSIECLNYDIYCSGTNGVLKDVNITVGVSMGSSTAKALANTQSTETITISATGWEESEYKPKVTVTASSTLYNIDASSAKDVGIDVTVKQPVNLESGGSSGGSSGGKKSSESSETDIGMIIGVVISVLVVVCVSAVVAFVIFRTYKKDASESNEA